MTRSMWMAAATLGLIVGLSSAQTTAEDSDAGATTNLPPPASMDSPPSPGPAAPPSDYSPVIAPGPYQALDGAGANGAGAGPWISSDYLLGYFQPARLPALVTTSPAGTPRAQAGVLGLPTTSTLFGGEVNSDVRSGFRISSGYWFNDERTWGLEVSFMMFESQSTFFSPSSTGSLILARPFTNAVTGLPDSVVVAFPGSPGSIAARDNSGNFYETHVDLSERICGCRWFRVDGILGYRFFRYDEGLRVQQTTSPTGAAFVPGTRISATDSFVAENEFNGFDLGFRTEIRGSNWTLDFLTKVATGGIFRQVKIDGNTTTTVPGAAPVTRSGGVFALSSNIGNHRDEDWTIFPEFGVNLSWQISSRLEMRLGYSFLFMSDIVRAHDQLNFNINPGLFPPATAAAGSPNEPSFHFHIGDAWIQAINVGLQYNF